MGKGVATKLRGGADYREQPECMLSMPFRSWGILPQGILKKISILWVLETTCSKGTAYMFAFSSDAAMLSKLYWYIILQRCCI